MASFPTLIATIKGNIHKTCKGLRSTRTKHNDVDLGYNSDDMNPPQEAHQVLNETIFFGDALADTIMGTIYTDITGRFPVRSVRHMPYVLCVMHIEKTLFWYKL